MYRVNIGGKWIGDGEPCFIIAEAGINHNGEITLAKQLIDEAKKAGADAVKFQTFKSEGVMTASAEMASYQKKNLGKTQSQIEMVRKYEFEYETFKELKKYCDDRGIIFLSTPHSYDAIDFLDPLVPAYKIGSGDITNLPAIEEIGKKGKPVLISAGMATLEEIQDAIETVRNVGNEQIVLLQCVTNYPADLKDQNLRTIKTMRDEYDVLTGFSDHTVGTLAAIIAVSLGACILEKHFTLSRDLPGPDHKASMEPQELKELVELVRDADIALGDGLKKPTKTETDIAAVARKSLVASINISKGTIITKDMIDIKRPGTGMKPSRLKDVIGKRARENIRRDDVLQEDMISWE